MRFMNQKTVLKICIADFWDGLTQRELDFFLSPLRDEYVLIEDEKEPDLLIYSCFGDRHLQYSNCKRLFVCGENVVPDFNACDYSISTLRVQFEDRNFFLPWGLFHNHLLSSAPSILPTSNPLDRKFCSFIYSQDTLGEGAKLRRIFCEQLMQYKHVDCPGKVLHNLDSPLLSSRHDANNWHESKVCFMSNYKFNIAFENSDAHGYITEKLVDCYMANTIPIYWGSRGDVAPFPKESMICAQDYDSLDNLINRIIEIDENNNLYMQILNANPFRSNIVNRYNELLSNMRSFLKFLVKEDSVSSHSMWSDSVRCGIYKRNLDSIRNSFLGKAFNYTKKLLR